MTDTERAALERRIDELCAEVESWRMVAKARVKQSMEVNEAYDALQTENAKLRELLADTVMPVDKYCAKYGLEYGWETANAHLDARMRELGIEVPE